MKYSLHPLCSVFPKIEPDQFEKLVASIKANGQQNPIVLYDGMILDGQNRYLACLEAGVEPMCTTFEGEDPKQFVLDANLNRRHLTVSQRAAMQVAIHDMRLDKPKSRISANLRTSAKDLAAEAQVSTRSIETARAIADKSPALLKQVAAGNVTLNGATQKLNKKQAPAPEPEPPVDNIAFVGDLAQTMWDWMHKHDPATRSGLKFEHAVWWLQEYVRNNGTPPAAL